MRIEILNLSGTGYVRTHVYDVPTADTYWHAVTDVPCPLPSCPGIIRWYEAGYVPAYRICDQCQRHFLGGGTSAAPALIRMGAKRGCLPEHRHAFRAARAARA